MAGGRECTTVGHHESSVGPAVRSSLVPSVHGAAQGPLCGPTRFQNATLWHHRSADWFCGDGPRNGPCHSVRTNRITVDLKTPPIALQLYYPPFGRVAHCQPQIPNSKRGKAPRHNPIPDETAAATERANPPMTIYASTTFIGSPLVIPRYMPNTRLDSERRCSASVCARTGQ